MSRVSEIYDSIKNLAVRLIDKIQESESYTQLQDRYQSLTQIPNALLWLQRP